MPLTICTKKKRACASPKRCAGALAMRVKSSPPARAGACEEVERERE
jgi:hypothetical protein